MGLVGFWSCATTILSSPSIENWVDISQKCNNHSNIIKTDQNLHSKWQKMITYNIIRTDCGEILLAQLSPSLFNSFWWINKAWPTFDMVMITALIVAERVLCFLLWINNLKLTMALHQIKGDQKADDAQTCQKWCIEYSFETSVQSIKLSVQVAWCSFTTSYFLYFATGSVQILSPPTSHLWEIVPYKHRIFCWSTFPNSWLWKG